MEAECKHILNTYKPMLVHCNINRHKLFNRTSGGGVSVWPQHVCICVYIYIYIYIYIYTCIHTYVYIYIYICVMCLACLMFVIYTLYWVNSYTMEACSTPKPKGQICMCVYINMCTCMYLCMYVCMCINLSTYIHIYIHT